MKKKKKKRNLIETSFSNKDVYIKQGSLAYCYLKKRKGLHLTSLYCRGVNILRDGIVIKVDILHLDVLTGTSRVKIQAVSGESIVKYYI